MIIAGVAKPGFIVSHRIFIENYCIFEGGSWLTFSLRYGGLEILNTQGALF